MLIKEWMSRSPITISSDKSINDAAKLFRTRMISMLPVMDGSALVGIVTDGDIKKATPSDATTLDKFELVTLMDSVKIKSIMSKPVITINIDFTVDEAASLMLTRGISGLPVLSGSGRMEGIITKSDVFRCFVSFTGVAGKGQIFAFKLMDKPGIIKTITDMIRSQSGRLCSIMTAYDELEDGFRKVFFHTFDIPKDGFEILVDLFRTSHELIYAADLSTNQRLTFNR